MKTMLAVKQNDEQKRTNEFVRSQFTMGMMNMEVQIILPLLKTDSIFLGYMSDWQFLSWLKSKFEIIKKPHFYSRVDERISLDFYPGAEVLEFKYVEMTEKDFVDFYPDDQTMEESVKAGKKTLMLKLVLIYENGKIADIRISHKSIEAERLNKYQIEN